MFMRNRETKPIICDAASLSITKTRAITRRGVLHEGLYYNDPCRLGAINAHLKQTGKKKVHIKYDPVDISYIYVLDPFDNAYIRIPAVEHDLVKGVSIQEHRAMLKAARAKLKGANAIAKAEIQRIIDMELAKRK